DKNGIVKHSTSGQYTTLENLQSYFGGKPLAIVDRNDIEDKTLLEIPYLDQWKQYDINNKVKIESYSFLTKKSPFTGQTSFRNSDLRITSDESGFALINASIVTLFKGYTFFEIGGKAFELKTIVEV